MEKNKANVITSSQAIVFILSIQIGIGILQIPKGVSKFAGHDSWISYLIAGILVFLAELLMIVLLKRFNGLSILEVNKKLFGRYIGFILNLLLIIYLLLSAAINMTIYTMIVAAWFFKTTSLWLLTLLLISPCVYAVYKGIKVVCRVNAIIYYIIIMAVFILSVNFIYFRPTQLLPIGDSGIYSILSGIPDTSFSFFGFETLLFIYPFIKNRQDAIKSMAIASTISTLLFVFAAIMCFGVFGDKMVESRTLPFAGLSRIAKFPILERVDLYFLATWIPGLVICVNTYYFLTYHSIKKVFNIKRNAPLYIVVTIMIAILSRYTEDMNVMSQVASYLGYVGYIIGFGIPIFWLLISCILKKREGYDSEI